VKTHPAFSRVRPRPRRYRRTPGTQRLQSTSVSEPDPGSEDGVAIGPGERDSCRWW